MIRVSERGLTRRSDVKCFTEERAATPSNAAFSSGGQRLGPALEIGGDPGAELAAAVEGPHILFPGARVLLRAEVIENLLLLGFGQPIPLFADHDLSVGVTFSECLWPEASSLNLMKTVPALDVPVFFFLGRHDHVIDAETSAAYFDVLSARFKTLVWFEESAHEPPAEEPAKFHRMMVELVRPLASAMPAATR